MEEINVTQSNIKLICQSKTQLLNKYNTLNFIIEE